jgi:DNA recombination protein RmuC
METFLPILTFIAGLAVGLGVLIFTRSFLRGVSYEAVEDMRQRERADSEARKNVIEEMLKPVAANLQVLTGAVEQLKSTDTAVRTDLLNLQKETAKLAGAIHNPAERGRFGEYILKSLLDKSGLIEGQHYQSQAAFSDSAGSSRPDFLIRVHDELRVAVDAKAPIMELMDDLDDEELYEQTSQRLAGQVREHVKALAKRDYTRMAGSPDFTVLFLPGDHLYAIVAKQDRALLDYAADNKVLIASPMLLIGLLKVIVMMARQVDTAQRAKEIATVGADLHARLRTFMEHFDKLGRALKSSFETYNKAVGSMERMVLPKAREFESLRSLKDSEGLPAPTAIEIAPRGADNEEKAA